MIDETLTSVVRILTSTRLGSPQRPEQVLEFCDRVRGAPPAVRLTPADTSWGIFTASVRDLAPAGNDMPDAWLAAVVSSARATLVTFDHGFRRFPRLEVRLLGA